METERYNVYSSHLKNKYGEKVYKLPINLPITCPNRDGTVSVGGCAFCGEQAAGFESLPSQISVRDQLNHNMNYIGNKYNAKKFIAYFQNFTNTYMPVCDFERYIKEAAVPGVVGIDVSTRPDCVAEKYLEIMRNTGDKNGIDMGIELGLQTVNYHTLRAVNRGHGLAEFIDAVLSAKRYNISVCAHVILDFPQDDEEDVCETAAVLSALGVDYVKLHSLYIVKNTRFARMYEKGELRLMTADSYVERCISFLRCLSPDICVQRIIGRAPEEDVLTANFGISWWKIKDMIIERMENQGAVQGDMCNRLGGSAVRKFLC